MVEKVVDQEVTNDEDDFIEPSIDEIIEESEVVKEVEKEEEPEKEPEKEPEPEPEEKVETEEKTEVEDEGLTEEQFIELSTKHPVLKEYKDYFDNYNKWEKTQRQKSQAIPYLGKLHEDNPEKFEAVINEIMPYVYGKKELPKASTELVDDVMSNIEIGDITFTDDQDFEVKVSKDKIEPMVRKATEQMLNSAVPQMTVLREKVSELELENKELKENYSASSTRQGELEMESLVTKHKMLDFNRTEEDGGILDAVNRVEEGGDGHPEYGKYMRWIAIGNLAQKNGWPLEKAFQTLFGADEKKAKKEEAIIEVALENQDTVTQEVPGGEAQESIEEWEEALEGVGKDAEEIDRLMK